MAESSGDEKVPPHCRKPAQYREASNSSQKFTNNWLIFVFEWLKMLTKTLLAILIFVSPIFAQDQAAAAHAAGCGPNEVKFNVKTDKKQHPTAQPSSGKALVYVFGGEDIDLGGLALGTRDNFTTRWGVDGVWLGAGYRNSYFFFSLDPGDHRLCAGRQASSKPSAALTITVEAGKAYYFRTKTHHLGAQGEELEPIDPAAAQLLIEASPSTVFEPRKSSNSDTE
jgi:hypothetical protein